MSEDEADLADFRSRRAVLRVDRQRADPLVILVAFGMSPLGAEVVKRTRRGRVKVRPPRRAIAEVSSEDGLVLGLAGGMKEPYVSSGDLVWIEHPGYPPGALFTVEEITDLGGAAAHVFMGEEVDTDSVEGDAKLSVGLDAEALALAEERTKISRLVKSNRELGSLEDLL